MADKQSILITGASGFLGQALVERLLHIENVQVTALCRYEKNCALFSTHKRLYTHGFDISDLSNFKKIITEFHPEVIFHLAAKARLQAGESSPEETIQTNLLAGINMLLLAAKTGVRKFIFTSSDLAREPRSVVGFTKLLFEYYLLLFPLQYPQVVGFRMPNLYNFPGSVMDIFMRQISQNKPLTLTDERMARRFLHREEACDYLLYLMHYGKSHQIYSVRKDPVLIKDIALQMIADSGKNLPLKIVGSKPGEKLYQASYSASEAMDTGYKHLALLKQEKPSLEKVFLYINKLPVSREMKNQLQNKFIEII